MNSGLFYTEEQNKNFVTFSLILLEKLTVSMTYGLESKEEKD